MPVLITCRSCVRGSECARRQALLAAVRGHGVTSLKHRCPEHEAKFHDGQAVYAKVQPASDLDYKEWFPGIFIGVGRPNTKGLVAIKAGERAVYGPDDAELIEHEFEPIKGEHGGVCKLPWDRIKPRDAENEPLCDCCGLPYRIMKCDGDMICCPDRSAATSDTT